MTKIFVTATGGTIFKVSRDGQDGYRYLGSMDFGTLDEDGQYEQDDDEVVEAARERFDLDDDLPVVVR